MTTKTLYVARYAPVDSDIEDLHANEHHNVVNSDGNQDCVASTVKRLVVVPVYLRGNDVGPDLNGQQT